MRLEFTKIAGEEVPFIVLECCNCGEGITIREREVSTSKPLTCSFCSHTRNLTYREYITITDRFAAQLLEYTVAKLGGFRTRSYRSYR